MSDRHAIELFNAATLIRVRDGDVIVFRTPEKLSATQHAGAAEVLEEAFGDAPVLILHGGEELTVMRRDPWWRRLWPKSA